MTATEPPRSASPGWGRYAPAQVLSNADLERMVDTSDEWIVSRTGIRERRVAAAHETTASMGAVAGLRAIRTGRPRAGRHRRDHPRDPHARLLDAVDRGAGQGGHRQHARRRRSTSWPPAPASSTATRRRGLHHRRAGEARAGHRRRAADPVPRLHGPQHLHPVRRRGRGGRAVGVGRADGPGRHRAHHRAAGRVHDLAARGRRQEPAVDRDDHPRRAQDPDGGQRDLPLRDPDARLDRARGRRQGRARARRRRPVHPAPGQHPDHRGGGQGPQPADGADVRQPRQVRQHLGRVGADRAGRGRERGPREGRRQDRVGRVRRRVHVRRRGHGVDRRSRARACSATRPSGPRT